jgi:hypothetical protein
MNVFKDLLIICNIYLHGPLWSRSCGSWINKSVVIIIFAKIKQMFQCSMCNFIIMIILYHRVFVHLLCFMREANFNIRFYCEVHVHFRKIESLEQSTYIVNFCTLFDLLSTTHVVIIYVCLFDDV